MKIQRIRTARSQIYPRLGLSHSGYGGAPVLKERASWRTVNGFFFRTRRSTVWVEFWRHV